MTRLVRGLSCLQLLAILALATPGDAVGSTCGIPPLEISVKATPFIFVGKVVKLEVAATTDEFDTIVAWVDVGEIFKGAPAAQVKFVTDTKSGHFSFDFRIAGEYLLFASEDDGYFTTSSCSHSKFTLAAEDDLRVLRAVVHR